MSSLTVGYRPQQMDIEPSPQGRFNELLPELLIPIFSEYDLTFKELTCAWLVCKNWKAVIEDATIGRSMMRKIQRVLVPKEQWMATYARWLKTTYWIVIDTSHSMKYKPRRFRHRDIRKYDANRETAWMRAVPKALEIFQFLLPVAPEGIHVCLFNKQTMHCHFSRIDDLRFILNFSPFDKESNLDQAIECILQNTPLNPSGFSLRSPHELFIISDFYRIPESADRKLFELAERTELTVNFLNEGYFQKPDILADFEKADKEMDSGVYRIDYDLKRDGINREREVEEEEDPSDVSYQPSEESYESEEGEEPPQKKRRIEQ